MTGEPHAARGHRFGAAFNLRCWWFGFGWDWRWFGREIALGIGPLLLTWTWDRG